MNNSFKKSVIILCLIIIIFILYALKNTNQIFYENSYILNKVTNNIEYLDVKTFDENLENTKVKSTEYSAKCLKSKYNYSKSFGTTLAINENYLVVSDPENNKVIIYNKKNNNNWIKIHDIFPPQDSLAEKRGFGFGYKLAIKNDLIAIVSYDYKHFPYENIYDETKQLGFELFSAKINSNDILLSSNIFPPTVKPTLSGVEFLNDKIAIIGTIKKDKQKKFYLFTIDPNTKKTEKYITLPKFKYVHENPELVIDSDNDSLFITHDSQPLKKHDLYFLKDKKITKNIFDTYLLESAFQSQNPIVSNSNISNKLIVFTSSEFPFFPSQIIVFKRYLSQFPITIINQYGSVDSKDSLLLITIKHPAFIENNKFDHLLIDINENETLIKSRISWERQDDNQTDVNAKSTGVITSDSLILISNGRIVDLPLENLPEIYQIKNSTCKE